jgi:predicted pyridoxine 5'-phosphate oxidase superfamily flavin-nucleotide-binding protein
MTDAPSSSGRGRPERAVAPQPDDVMFSSAVRAEQACRGSRDANARRAAAGRFAQTLTAEVIAFIRERNSAYFATASADGQPYVQHRGGPKGFIKVLDEQTLAFPEYPGNRQYISTGHLSENDRAFLFLMDYANARRLKLWGRAKVVADDKELIVRINGPLGRAGVERAIVFAVLAWDWNCSQHIPRLVSPD